MGGGQSTSHKARRVSGTDLYPTVNTVPRLSQHALCQASGYRKGAIRSVTFITTDKYLHTHIYSLIKFAFIVETLDTTKYKKGNNNHASPYHPKIITIIILAHFSQSSFL